RAREHPQPVLTMTNTSTLVRGGRHASAPGRGPSRRTRRGLPVWSIPYVLLIPGLLVIGALLLYPMVQVAIMAFQKVGLPQIAGRRPPEFVGTDNFAQILDNQIFWDSLRNTVVFAVITVTLTLVLGTAVGVLLSK